MFRPRLRYTLLPLTAELPLPRPCCSWDGSIRQRNPCNHAAMQRRNTVAPSIYPTIHHPSPHPHAKQLEQASGLDVYCAQVNANERTNMEQIVTRSGLKLTVEQRPVDRRVEVLLKTDPEPGCVLHWGVRE